MRKISPPEAARRVERMTAAVRAAGVKLTHQRLEIIRTIAASTEHPDVEAVSRAVRVRMPTVSQDTVYRTLWLLRDLGLAKTLGPPRDGMRFDANLDPHHHYVCVRCGLVRDFESADLDALRLPEAVRRLGRVVDAHVEVRGVCATCARKDAATAEHRPQSSRDGADHE